MSNFITQSLFDFLDKGKEIIDKTKNKSKEKKKKQNKKAEGKVIQMDLFNVNSVKNEKPSTIKEPSINKDNFELKQSESNSILTRIKNNIVAIKLAKKLKKAVRKADMFEKDLIAQYTGWGGLQDLFQKEKYIKEKETIEEILTEEEYKNALSSINTSFYTNKTIISFIYDALKKMGFKNGRILEPSCGIGNFIGYMPQDMKNNSNIIGIEKEGLAASIATQLYQNNIEIQHTGFENAKILDNYFDVVVGNVPFGDIRVHDKNYDKYALSIHNYFIVKSLDKVRPGGIVALITSSFTMGSKTTKVREIIAEKANLVAAIKLPNTAFGNTNTSVVSDILIFQKRLKDDTESNLSEWIYVNNEINQYFSNNSKMIAGNIEEVSGPFGKTYTVKLNGDLEHKLNEILEYIPQDIYSQMKLEEKEVIWADNNVIEDEFVILNNKLYQNQNGILVEQNLSSSSMTYKRIVGMIQIKDQVQHIINIQLEGCSDDILKEEQQKLSTLYDHFVLSYGYINSTANSRAYNKDSYYSLISSIEVVENDKITKGDIFSKRTIQLPKIVEKADSIEEAYYITLGEKGKLDFNRISTLVNKTEKEVIEYLNGKLIFFNPVSEKWETEDEYLSGNVRKKLEIAKEEAEFDEKFKINVEALEKVQPTPITAEDITVNFGATWVPKDIYRDFILYILEARNVNVEYNKIDASWEVHVSGCPYNVLHYKYGTERKNALAIIEAGINLRVPNVFDTIIDPNTDKEKRVINAKESMLAIQKLEEVEIEFSNWIFKDLNRRKILEEIYNEKFNSVIPRRFSGDHLIFPYKNPNIAFRPNQLKAIARCLTGNSTLLAHCVGAGKTYIMVAAAMRLKQMGTINKPLFAIPNHLVESGQFAREFNTLYPHAKILSATPKDFTKSNRKKLISKIALFDWDAIIIGHSSFDRISVSKQRQKKYIQNEIDEIEEYILEMDKKEDRIGIGKLEKIKENLEAKLTKLSSSKTEEFINFEELGVDSIFVDEAHNYKNLFFKTKMGNIKGVQIGNAQRATNLLQKIQYLYEIKGEGNGVVFATGTPVSNSMVEVYTMQKYLQPQILKEHGLYFFDQWASSFGKIVNSLEVDVTGQNLKSEQRFAKFNNVPELSTLFRMTADVVTKDMINLPIPMLDTGKPIPVEILPSPRVKEYISSLAERARLIRNSSVDPKKDNMLKITTEGKKIALDYRLMFPNEVEDEHNKVKACAEKVYSEWLAGKEEKLTQLIFCNYGTPGNKDFNLYAEIVKELVMLGIPREEIGIIHDAKTPAKKEVLINAFKEGNIRILIGSISKMGEGLNAQDRIVATHELDVPWKPAEITQLEGRMLRQGNINSKVKIYRYICKGTFDAFAWQTVARKANFIDQFMKGDTTIREMEDLGDGALDYETMVAIASENPLIMERMKLQTEVTKYSLLEAKHKNNIFKLQDKILKCKNRINIFNNRYTNLLEDIKQRDANSEYIEIEDTIENTAEDIKEKAKFIFTTNDNKTMEDRIEVGAYIKEQFRNITIDQGVVYIGSYRGFEIGIQKKLLSSEELTKVLKIKFKNQYEVEASSSEIGISKRLENVLSKFEQNVEQMKEVIQEEKEILTAAETEVKEPFKYAKELIAAKKKLKEIEQKLCKK